MFWCLFCSILICDVCSRTDHKSHPVRRLNEAALLKLVQTKFRNDIAGFLTTRRNEIKEMLAKISWETEKTVSKQVRMRKLVENLEKKRALVELCLQRLSNEVEETKHNRDLLLTILQMDVNSSECVGYKHKCVQTAKSNVKFVATGTQTEESTNMSASTQTENFFSISIILAIILIAESFFYKSNYIAIFFLLRWAFEPLAW